MSLAYTARNGVAIMKTPRRKSTSNKTDFATRSNLYQEFLAEREEILRHKWIESEKAGYDVGFERALLDWIRKHRDEWRKSRRESPSGTTPNRAV